MFSVIFEATIGISPCTMPNFFKKLTGSLKMPDEGEDFFTEETPKNDEVASGQEKNAMPEQPDTGFSVEQEEELIEKIPSAEQSQPEKESHDAESATADMPKETLGLTPDELAEEEAEDEGGSESEAPAQYEETADASSPYTIADLAQATTVASRKKDVAKKSRRSSALRKLKPFAKKSKKNEKRKEIESEPEGQLAIDVYETPSHIIIKSTIAGVDPKDLDIGIEENTVNIRGSRHAEREDKGMDYFYQECYWGTFSRSIILPVEVNSDETEASLKNGVLTIKLPKIQKEKEKKIKVLG